MVQDVDESDGGQDGQDVSDGAKEEEADDGDASDGACLDAVLVILCRRRHLIRAIAEMVQV